MKIKTYKHRSLQEGLENIKRDLGSEALILSTREVPVRPRFSLFKRPAWEITAAVEERLPTPVVAEKSEAAEKTVEKPAVAAISRAAAATAVTTVAPVMTSARDPRMDALLSEITEL